ncbi:uncharacterized protein LOC123556393 [Mercenaria mercenaria]|uniref:uncharacterized protein LOC123556393 n=1 Tax=Mercenaria mercenaria TaxID=6596 RepID=UPI00234EA77E|nr:uncharacterized protein LOC123556393 [Mercenaria mercenaria]
MASRFSGYLTSSVGLRLGSAVLLVGVTAHLVGYSVAQWASTYVSGGLIHGTSSSWVNLYVGLWQRCVCAPNSDTETCTCVPRSGDPAWFKVIQVMETLGLIGLIFSGIISLVLVCYRQTKTITMTNTILIFCSGVCILIGLVIFVSYGVENNKDFKDMFSIVATADVKDNTLSASFFLCALAAFICFGVLPLFMVGLRTLVPPANRQTIPESNESQVTSPRPCQTQKICNAGQSPICHQSEHMHGQYGKPPAYEQYEAPPAYTYENLEAPPAYTYEQHETSTEHIYGQNEAPTHSP